MTGATPSTVQRQGAVVPAPHGVVGLLIEVIVLQVVRPSGPISRGWRVRTARVGRFLPSRPGASPIAGFRIRARVPAFIAPGYPDPRPSRPRSCQGSCAAASAICVVEDGEAGGELGIATLRLGGRPPTYGGRRTSPRTVRRRSQGGAVEAAGRRASSDTLSKVVDAAMPRAAAVPFGTRFHSASAAGQRRGPDPLTSFERRVVAEPQTASPRRPPRLRGRQDATSLSSSARCR